MPTLYLAGPDGEVTAIQQHPSDDTILIYPFSNISPYTFHDTSIDPMIGELNHVFHISG